MITVELLILSALGGFYTHRFSQEIDNAIIARLSIAGLLMTRGELSFDAVSDRRTMEGLLRAPYSEGIVIGLDGHVYYSFDPARRDTHLDEIDGLKLPGSESSPLAVDTPDLIVPIQDSSGTYLTCLSPLRPNGKLTGYLYLKVGTKTTETEKKKVAILFAVGSLATVTFTAAILTLLLNFLVIRRLNDLIDIFRRFALGDYAARAQALDGGDEFATLMDGFNGLAKRLEETVAHLSESETLLNTTQRLSKVGGWEVDIKSGKAFWTDELYRLHEIPKGSDIDHRKESFACYSPEDRQTLNEAFTRACELGEPYDLELPFTTYTGKPLWVRTTAQPVYEDGKVVRLVGNLMDITERKQAEEALRLSSERLQLATRVANIGIWDWDIPRNSLVWDDSMYQLYGIRKGDFSEAYDAWISTIHPEDKAHTDGEIQAALRGEHEYAPEFRIVRPDGSIRNIKAVSRTTRDQEGKPLRMIGTNIDITELKLAETSIRTLNQTLEQRVADRTAQLEAANKELEAFAYSVSHDLRAPLRHIDGFLDLLKARTTGSLDDKSKHYMDTISDAARRMGTLIDDLLGFSRMGRKEMAAERVDLDILLQEVIHEFDSETRGRNIDWHIGELPAVTGDRAMLRVVLLNLISNALKFTQKREKASIEIGSQPGAGEAVIIFVRDNGAGFDMLYADKLFGVFQRLHSSDEFEGTGIGLANVHRIINRHGGKTWAEGKVDGGASFYFSLPQAVGAK
ncbi:PAS domain-containing protein [Rhodoferax sp.]|uniref:PAS domain-containing protein n=1 Tax=Rhodoferax sp. TaxID=50421 RepID=UPI0028491AE9|nr:PAS domain-containing protein [Rhodoferax sp.]MDR3368268.1 PAS domain-containing protein [Rhodoferax sp.]